MVLNSILSAVIASVFAGLFDLSGKELAAFCIAICILFPLIDIQRALEKGQNHGD